MLRIGRRRRQAQHGEREERGGKVDERLERVGKKSDGAGQPPGERLECNGGKRRADRDPGVALKRHKPCTSALPSRAAPPPGFASPPMRTPPARCVSAFPRKR